MAEAGIRRAETPDLPFIAGCTRAAYAKYLERLGREPQPMVRDYRGDVELGRVWILESRDGPCGLLVLLPDPDHLLIYSIAVAPGHQGRGHGRRLLRFAAAEARRQGFKQLRLYTNEHMTENIRLYTKAGYHETHREPFKDTQTVHMALDLEETPVSTTS